jgi:predicted lipoprotein with Yx(FWY)xxD motif
MRARLLLLAPLAAVAALATVAVADGAAAPSKAPSKASAKAATVSVRRTRVGRVLVDAQGRTLYLFMKDTHDKSACAGACAKGWPPLLTTATPKAGKGAEAKLLGTTVRRSGRQVTYAGHPLYTYIGDKRAGQTHGEGSTAFGASWYAVAADGRRVDKS